MSVSYRFEARAEAFGASRAEVLRSTTDLEPPHSCIASITKNMQEIGIRISMCYLVLAVLALP